MKKQYFIIPVVVTLMLMVSACTEENDVAVTPQPIEFRAAIDNAVTRAYPTTPYENTTFATGDQIGVFVVRPSVDLVISLDDIYQNYFNVGYKHNGNNAWGLAPSPGGDANMTKIFAPVLPVELEFYAYYPWLPFGDQPSVLNFLDSENIVFRILQDQSVSSMPRCNIMRARVAKKEYQYNGDNTVTFQFEHILSLFEFQISAADANGTANEDKWQSGDSVRLDRVVVLGNKVSTEGVFDMTAANPNVRITSNHTTSNSSIYKADTPITGSAIPIDGISGATPTYGRNYLRRTVIIPPILIEKNNPSVGERADLEFLIEMRWKAKDENYWRSTNRRFIVQSGTFESGHRYLFEMKVQKKPLPQYDISVKGISKTWEGGTYTYTYTFD